MQSSSQSYIVFGETGAGKTTFIAQTFKPSTPITVARSRASDTSEVNSYNASSNSPACFRMTTFKDTPGLLDTRGITSAQIFQMIEVSLVQDSSLDGKISGILIVESTIFTRSRINNLIGELVAAFTNQILKSCVVVLNRYSSISQANLNLIKNETCSMVQDATRRAGMSMIPVVILNCSAPDTSEINVLANAMTSLQPYYFSNIVTRNQEIENIYQTMMNDPNNYVTDTKQRIKYVTVNKTRTIQVPKLRQEVQFG